jgi:signal transduction histidine kinase/ligand-binding sensor domain-containing protein
MIRRIFPQVVCFLLLCFGPTLKVRAERLPIRSYSSADGLGSSFVSYLMVDSRGFLWICTRDGLSRFDGSQFVTYQVGDKGSPPGIEQIIETRKGIYWIVTTGGLYRFDPSAPPVNKSTSNDRPALNAELVDNNRGWLLEDRDGNLWSGGDGLYLREYQDGKLTAQKTELNLPPNPMVPFSVSRIIEGLDRSLWMLTSRGLLRRLHDGTEVWYATGSSNPYDLTSVMEDRDGRIWLGRLGELDVIKPDVIDDRPAKGAPKTLQLDQIALTKPAAQGHITLPDKPGEIVRYPNGAGFIPQIVNCMYGSRDGHVWISSGDGLIEVDGQEFQTHASAPAPIRGLAQIIEDKTGNLWLGSSTALIRFNRRGLTSYAEPDGMNGTYVVAINQTVDDRLYVTGPDFQLNLFYDHSFRSIRPRLPPEGVGLWTANTCFQDSSGEWWFLTRGKLYRFAATKDLRTLARDSPRQTYDQRDGFKFADMFHIFEDSRSDLWISTSPSGLSRWDRKTGAFQTFTEAEGFPDEKAPSSFAEDKSGNLWFGFNDGGLVRYAAGRFTEFRAVDGAPLGLITALYVNPQGTLWIGSSQQGVTTVAEPATVHPKFVALTTENGLASNNVRALTGDPDGNVYVGTARGVDRVSADAARIKHYSTSDGLAADFVTSAFRERNGTVWFGTTTGVSRLEPVQEALQPAPPVLISGLRIAGERQPVSVLGSAEVPLIEVAHTQNNLQIEFFGIDFGAAETLRYQYKLESTDKDWSAPTLQRAVTYANVAPGSYRFLVRAVSPDGLVSEQLATISLRILPPVWQRWWFLTIAALIITGMLYSIYRYRVAQLLKVERVRTRIATDLHDDIGASLSRMAILSEVVKQQRAGDNGDQSAGLLTEIADSARGLVDSMSDIVWSIDPRRDDLQSLVRRIRQFASDVLEARGIDWELQVPPEVESLKLDPDERQHLFLILKESINNIARHGEGTKTVSLSINVEGRQLIAEIKDDGCGFTPKEPDDARSKGRGGNGLPNMRERAAQLGGRLEIASSPGAGTLLTLRMPIK